MSNSGDFRSLMTSLLKVFTSVKIEATDIIATLTMTISVFIVLILH